MTTVRGCAPSAISRQHVANGSRPADTPIRRRPQTMLHARSGNADQSATAPAAASSQSPSAQLGRRRSGLLPTRRPARSRSTRLRDRRPVCVRPPPLPHRASQIPMVSPRSNGQAHVSAGRSRAAPVPALRSLPVASGAEAQRSSARRGAPSCGPSGDPPICPLQRRQWLHTRRPARVESCAVPEGGGRGSREIW